MASTAARFEKISRSEGEVLLEETTRGRGRVGLAVGCGLLLAAAAAFALSGYSQSTQFLKGTDTISKADQLQTMIDENNAEIANLKTELDTALQKEEYGNFALLANNLQTLIDQNARNEVLRQKVIKAGDDLLGGEYDVVDTSLDMIIADKCNATTMTEIAHLKIKAKNATDHDEFDSVKTYLKQVTGLFPNCENLEAEPTSDSTTSDGDDATSAKPAADNASASAEPPKSSRRV